MVFTCNNLSGHKLAKKIMNEREIQHCNTETWVKILIACNCPIKRHELIPSLVAKFQWAQNLISCPECNAPMVEIDRWNKNGSFFGWYECSRNNCDVQWLRTISQNGSITRINQGRVA
jgi:hypothetical protein